jgi:hypothetical protein
MTRLMVITPSGDPSSPRETRHGVRSSGAMPHHGDMSLDVDEQRATRAPHHPARWWWAIAGTAAVVVVAVVLSVVLWLREGDDGGSRSDLGRAAVPSAAPTSTPLAALQVPAAAGRCMVPSADVLGQRPIAFAGRVDSVTDGVVTLAVTDRIAGDVASTVVVHEPARTSEPTLTFAAGHTYLVAADADGTVAVCGLSGERTPALSRLYAAAFGG